MIPNCFYNGVGQCLGYDVRAKEQNKNNYMWYMFDRTQSIFKYDGLPDTIPQRILEFYLQFNGNVCFARHNGELYVFTGGLGGKPDVYYRPTIYTVANPALEFSANLKIGEDCVVVLSDSMYMGLLPMFERYASQLVENDLTLHMADINGRIMALLTAQDDRSKKAGEQYLKDVEDGKLGVIAESAFLEGLKSQPYASPGLTNQITQLIEYQQYLKAGWFNDLGLQANYNMKRESINSNEAQLNEQSLLPLIDDMLRCRRLGLDEVNKMFGTNITVDLDSSWAVQHNEMSMGHDDLEDTPGESDPVEMEEETPGENNPVEVEEETTGEGTNNDDTEEKKVD